MNLSTKIFPTKIIVDGLVCRHLMGSLKTSRVAKLIGKQTMHWWSNDSLHRHLIERKCFVKFIRSAKDPGVKGLSICSIKRWTFLLTFAIKGLQIVALGWQTFLIVSFFSNDSDYYLCRRQFSRCCWLSSSFFHYDKHLCEGS